MQLIHIYLSLAIGLATACSTTAPGTNTPNTTREELANTTQTAVGNNNSMQLSDYLRRIPGLQIEQRGSNVNVMIRGMNSISSDNSPLFVIDQQPVGNDYNAAASAVDVNDIKTVNVIKSAEGQQLYGMRGANGVVQIITRKR